jgi:HD-GYP domain-containing protein (c-di-GMP phosphodiesterase class II)/uncharacterized membrane protein YhdT
LGKIKIYKTPDNKTCIPWRLLIALSLIGLVLMSIALIQPLGQTVYPYFYGLANILCPLLFSFICIKGSLLIIHQYPLFSNHARSGRRFTPLLLGFSLLWIAIAQIASLVYLVYTHAEAPFPSLSYELMFGIYPFLILAILLLPAREISLLARLRIFLDSLIVIVAVATLCTYFVLAPILMLGDGTIAEKLLGTLFPAADLVSVFCLLLVALRSGEAQLRPVLIMLGLALLIIFFIHVKRLSEVLNNTFYWITCLTVFWTLATILIVGAVQTVKNTLKKEEAGYMVPETAKKVDLSFSVSSWRSWLPLALVLGASLLVFLLWVVGDKQTFRSQIGIIYIGGFVVLMLIILRQFLALYEIWVLQGKLQRRNRSLSLLNDLLAKQATTDSLTGLPNHRELVARLDQALEHAQATTSTCAIIFIDFDHFKAINDYYGHLVGDTVLREFSELVTASSRALDDLFSYSPTDQRTKENLAPFLTSPYEDHTGRESPRKSGDLIIGRWGGEEFVVILPGVMPDGVFHIAERIRVLVEQHVFAGEQKVHLTCSLGTATYPFAATRREELLLRADRAMYTAKRLGRNQTRMSLEPLVLAMGMLDEPPETAEEAEMLAVVESLIVALEARDRPTGQHSRRVAAVSLKLALALGLPWSDACIVGMGGLLHDLGKVAMPDTILLKRGKLSAAEIEYMARHPLIGQEILTPLPSLHAVAEIVRAHHEWIDGSGYPDGLQGEAIPLGARIVAVADACDAIISHRVYREGRASSEAIKELSKGAGKQFDPRVVAALDHLLATPYPLITSVA